MNKSLVWALTALVVTSLTAGASAEYIYSPSYTYYEPGQILAPAVYSAPIPVGLHSVYVSPAPVVVSSPVYFAPVPVVMARPVYVIPQVVPMGVVRQSLIVRPHSSTYVSHGHGWGTGHHYYERSTPFRTVIRGRNW